MYTLASKGGGKDEAPSVSGLGIWGFISFVYLAAALKLLVQHVGSSS